MSKAYFTLANGSLTQDWSNAGLITTNDDWSGVPSIEGYLGQDITTATGTDPRTLALDSTVANDLDAIANQSNTTITNGGVAEFDGIANPTIALQGSGTADAPYIILYLDATGRQDVHLQFNARDIDGTADSSIQQLNVQYRIGETGAWSNVPGGYIADATSGPSASSMVTPIDVTLPAAANNQAQVQVRIMTTNAAGSDEWVGIDDLNVSSSPFADTTPPALVSANPSDEAGNISTASDIILTFDESVQLGAGNIVISDGSGDTRTISVGGGPDPDGAVTISGNAVTINPTSDLAAGAVYHVTIADGAIQDTSGNHFAGIGAGQLDFTTAAEQSFSIAATDANKGEGSAGTTPFTFTVTRTNPTGDATVDWSVTGPGGANQADGADFSGATSGKLTFTGTETSKTITINVAGDLAVEPNETFTVTLSNASPGSVITTASAAASIQNDDVPLTAIFAIQGSGHLSQLAGQTISTTGVVTAVDTNGSRGFYIQDPNGDGNAATSDGIFVFLPNGELPEVGHLVRVSGTVQEFTPSDAAVGSFSTTEISSVTNVTDLGDGPDIAPVQIGGPGGLVPPTESLIAGSNFFESLEGMLVTVKDAQATGPTNSFGEIFSVVDNDSDPANGTLATGQTDRGNLLLTPGASDFGDTNTSGGDFNPERVQIDDDNGILPGFSSPLVNVGAQLGDVTGIVNYDFGNYQVVATQAYGVTAPSTLTKETGTLSGDADHLLVASYNAENLDPGDGAARFATIADQILHNLNAPDVVALQEVQDGSGPTNDGVTSADATLQMLVDALNAAAPAGVHYAYIDNPFIGDDTNGGEPGGNIRTAFLYRTDRVDFASDSLRTIGADGSAVTTSYVDQQTNPDNPFFDSRPPLVATFNFHGEAVTVVDNHFTSKGGSAPLLGSDQPPFDAGEVQRAAQAQAVNTFIDNLLSSDAQAKVIVAGDLNEFQFEEPMAVLKGTATISNYDVPGTDPFDAVADYTPGGTAILNDLQDLLPANERYDYVFEGNSETLDHVFVSDALSDVAQFDVVRINAEFADQTSDHDPLLARFAIPLNDAPVAADDVATTAEDTPVIVNVLGNDIDPDHDALAISAINGRAFDQNHRVVLAEGTVTLNADATLTFAPNANFNGPVAFDYTATDGQLSDTGTVNVAVSAVNDAPTLTSPPSFMVSENHKAVGTVAAVDPEHDAFSFALEGGSDQKLFSIDPHTGALSFLSLPDFETPEDANHDNVYDLVVSATDAFGASNSQTIHVAVANVAESGQTFSGRNGNDNLTGGTGNDTMSAGNGSDRLNGNDGNDKILGGNGNDTVIGGRGNDALSGGNGNDILTGGAGNDKLEGGNGNDTFVFASSFGHDSVSDFRHGDRIEFDNGVFGNFHDVEMASHQVGHDTVITVDANSSIVLENVALHSLHASDFLFV
ncbi:Ig-like domain-containing protein [Bradyrhizobium cenepequi]|uniref:Ig-like domain-containing protein n=1 Tax=Bradyrhizobium cenepequi TaxID=2821403 RepID=UPI001CE34D08|nr:Ig-like domain-containing protein [Bradyrhizobium cenepequi]MCA6109806.1 Ig-like domain-containing protein [Bradyrhizobium cenepequi]